MLRIDDAGRVRTLTLDRPEALNACNDDLYDAVRDALLAAAVSRSRPSAWSPRPRPACCSPSRWAGRPRPRPCLTSDWITADQAVEAGLARRKVPADRLMAETLELADRIAAMPVSSLVATKRLMKEHRAEAVDAAFEREWAQFTSMIGVPANAEALAAFREKRPPDFSAL